MLTKHLNRIDLWLNMIGLLITAVIAVFVGVTLDAELGILAGVVLFVVLGGINLLWRCTIGRKMDKGAERFFDQEDLNARRKASQNNPTIL